MEQEQQRCGNCAHFERCVFIFDAKPDDTDCDWDPSRWTPKPNTVSK